jgi:hypothetical protein
MYAPHATDRCRSMRLQVLAMALLPACLGQAVAQALTLRAAPPNQDGRTQREPVRFDQRPWMTIKPPEAGVGAVAFEHGALGLQLESGFRLQLKSRRGGLALALRNTF